jgi:hypothetical protein
VRPNVRHRSSAGAARGLTALVAAAGVLGLAQAADLFAEAPAVPRAPARLSETGLYDGSGAVAAANRPFSPQYPLWTDGASKSRWIHLPPGTTIDVSDIDAWKFPVGTKLWKEFAWNGRKVETRLIWRATDDRWVFATYAWTDDQTDALLVPESGVRNAFEVAAGKNHSIPGTADCATCHEAAPSPVLGFSALQLSDDRDPLAPHAEPLPEGAFTLRVLDDERRLDPPRPDLVAAPPRIREKDPVARAALGYLSSNCGTCHNGSGSLARLGFNLLHDAGAAFEAFEPAHATAVGAPTRFPIPGVSDDSVRVVAPGRPGQSALFHRMKSRRPSSQMPPLGTVLPDTLALGLVRRWIEGLAHEEMAANR